MIRHHGIKMAGYSHKASAISSWAREEAFVNCKGLLSRFYCDKLESFE